MWQMREGAGVMEEHEARVFLDAAGMMADDLADEMAGGTQTTYGVRSFDCREPGQRLRLLADILAALLDPDVPAPVPIACTEGTVDAILNHVVEMVRQEVEYELLEGPHPALDIYSWRRVVRACTVGGNSSPISLESVDMAVWNSATESLRERVLGKREADIEAEGRALEPKEMRRAELRKKDCFYSTMPSKPDAEEIVRLWRRVRAHTHVESSGR